MEARSYKIPLGFQGTLRLKMLPSITLKPRPLSAVQNITALTSDLPLELDCDDVRSTIPCSLTWLLLRDGTPEPLRITHPSVVFLVASAAASGGPLKNVRLPLKGDAAGAPLKVDVMALGLYGTGSLGYELTPLWPEATTVTLPPAGSNIRVAMEAKLELLDLHDQPLRSTSDFLVGRQYQVRPKFAAAFANQWVRLNIREVDSEGGLPQLIDFKVDGAMPSFPLVAGFNKDQFDYRSLASGSEAKLHYVYSFLFLKQKGGNTEINKDAAPVPDQPLFTIPKPQLAEFSASSELRSGNDEIRRITFKGKFENMEKEYLDDAGDDLGFGFLVNVTLFARYFDERAVSKPPTIRPIEMKPLPVPVKRGSFSGYVTLDIIDQEEWKKLEGQEGSDLSFFVVLSLHPNHGTRAVKKKGTTGKAQPLVFFEIADYDGNPQHHGMPAIERDRLTFKYWGTGVCSDLVGVHGQLAEFQGPSIDEMEALALAMCIWTEANDNADPAARAAEMRHVGGVIMNRRNTNYHDKTSTLSVVLDPGQFSHFNNANPEKNALISDDPAKVWQWSAGLGASKPRFDECVAVARELLEQDDKNPWHAQPMVRHYYSPRSMRPLNSTPAWYDASKEEIVPTIDKHRFRWFKNIL